MLGSWCVQIESNDSRTGYAAAFKGSKRGRHGVALTFIGYSPKIIAACNFSKRASTILQSFHCDRNTLVNRITVDDEEITVSDV